jgi:hypothetical protein
MAGGPGPYRAGSTRERQALKVADRSVAPADVRADFHAFEDTVVAWAGIIEDIRFKETERTVQVAFRLRHCGFDWIDRGGAQPYRATETGQGTFLAGWTVGKPTRIGYLKTLAQPGDLLLVYGRPYRMVGGIVQLSAEAVRPIGADEVLFAEEAVSGDK